MMRIDVGKEFERLNIQRKVTKARQFVGQQSRSHISIS